ncbi:alpha/beta hydrolase [Sphaerisporangium krabiense]|uniref:Pimeloyl-ACP methyl ester carboxylesterase n=1 Tax=Sphaerisporangium krabiense TaxID=763782 RepID=A0A7W8ZCE2_9ACTN|nr:alpha/beta fold hydrolase [Sphaerisporangium krabiense]MBB5631473.1 pimeloyl-ACP methyl ester carboxylesterase [Sphaerisporangium krabiense]GII60891.1 alpha/beta hydrolase [Sphaerisporangium krabiense]
MMTTRERRPRGAATWLLAGATVAALVGAAPASAEERPAWRDCAGEGAPTGLQCATIEVPVDWAAPDGRRIRLDLARLPATEPARRIGSVLGVPGGPGAEGIEDLKLAAGDLTELRRRFDLVGYDPRTTVWRDRWPQECARPGAALSDPRDQREYAALAAAMTSAFTRCRAADTTGLFAHMDSLSVARDMDAVRRALGEERLSFMANSYGGVAAAAYARLFPRRIRAMYLDGAVNQVDGWPGQHLRALPVRERIFTRFTAWCAATPACALHGEDAGAVWRGLTRAADREPIPVTSPEFGRGELTGWHLRSFAFPGDPGPGDSHWLAFAEAVGKARHGDGSGFADLALGNARVWAMPAALAMTCADGRGYRDYAELDRFGAQARTVSPNFGGASFDALGCAGWPLPVVNPARPLRTRGLPPFLGAGSTWGDYVWTESFTRMVPGSVTVAYDGPGHVLYLAGKRCPIRYATSYLTELKLPEPGTTCPAE